MEETAKNIYRVTTPYKDIYTKYTYLTRALSPTPRGCAYPTIKTERNYKKNTNFYLRN
mgnify:CR=1 FL=1